MNEPPTGTRPGEPGSARPGVTTLRVPERARKRPGFWERRLRPILLGGLEVLLIAGGLVVTVVVSAAVTYTLAVQGNEVTVPDLVGSSLEGASELVRKDELNLVAQGNRFDETIPPDFVAAQDPLPGSRLKKGRKVRVWVSLGPARHSVPRIEGESLQSAQLILEQAGLSLGRVSEIHSPTYAPDTVVAQSPQAYEEAGDDTEVSVLLSRGYLDDAFVMPDFIGHDYTELLDELGGSALRVSEIRMVDYPGVDKNVVVRQTPASGTKVYKRDRIILYLSKGR